MSLMVKEEHSGEPIPTGMQQAVCAMVCDIGTHRGEYQGTPNERHQIVIIWELEEKKTLGQYAGEPFQASKFYTKSIGKKSKLRADIQSWRGKPFTEEELKGFDLEKLIGANCFLNIIEENDKRKIQSITPITKNMVKIKPTLQVEPEWVSKFRAKSIEAQGIQPGEQQEPPLSPEEEFGF